MKLTNQSLIRMKNGFILGMTLFLKKKKRIK